MTVYSAPLENMRFVLNELLEVEKLTELPGFEEANRALYGGDRARFEGEIAGWPGDVRAHLARWADAAFAPVEDRA